jgi:hypothetical protein
MTQAAGEREDDEEPMRAIEVKRAYSQPPRRTASDTVVDRLCRGESAGMRRRLTLVTATGDVARSGARVLADALAEAG